VRLDGPAQDERVWAAATVALALLGRARQSFAMIRSA
jgi:hypothetical protein